MTQIIASMLNIQYAIPRNRKDGNDDFSIAKLVKL